MLRNLLFFIKLKGSFAFNFIPPKNNGAVLLSSGLHLGIETVYCRLLQRIDGKDGHGLKAKPARNANKNHQKIVMVTVPWQMFFISSL